VRNHVLPSYLFGSTRERVEANDKAFLPSYLFGSTLETESNVCIFKLPSYLFGSTPAQYPKIT